MITTLKFCVVAIAILLPIAGIGMIFGQPQRAEAADVENRDFTVFVAAVEEKKHAGCACQVAANGKAANAADHHAHSNGDVHGTNGNVDFTKMSPAQKVAFHKAKWDRILG